MSKESGIQLTTKAISINHKSASNTDSKEQEELKRPYITSIQAIGSTQSVPIIRPRKRPSRQHHSTKEVNTLSESFEEVQFERITHAENKERIIGMKVLQRSQNDKQLNRVLKRVPMRRKFSDVNCDKFFKVIHE